MIKRLILYPLLAILVFTACGIEVTKKFPGIDPKVKDDYDYFLDLTDNIHTDLTVGFGKINPLLGKSTIGVCNYITSEITLDVDYWKYAMPLERKALLYHEACHCIQRVGHFEGLDSDDGCPLSLMNPFIPSYYCLNKYWNFYLVELQLRCGK